MPETPRDVAEEYKRAVRELFGIYLDLTIASGELARSWMNWHLASLNAPEPAFPSREAALNPMVAYAAPDGAEVSETSLLQLIDRNRPGGRNWQLLGSMFVVMVYELWEVRFRNSLADALGRPRDTVLHDVFGELRHLRRSIIHRGARAMPEAALAVHIPAFPENEPISLSHDDLNRIVAALEMAVDELTAGEV